MDTNTEEKIIIENDQIALKSVFLTIGAYVKYALKYWWFILLIGMLLGSFFAWRAYKSDTTYQAALTFFLTQSEGTSSYSGLLRQFGIGTTSAPGGTTRTKLLEILESRNILEKVLFRKVGIGGKMDYYANHYLDVYEFRERWKENDANPAFYEFNFTHDTTSKFTVLENAVLQAITSSVASQNLNHDISESGIVYLIFKSKSEKMSCEFLNELYDIIVSYYTVELVEKQKSDYEIISNRRDSLFIELSSAESRLASFNDSNRGRYKVKSYLTDLRMKRDLQILNTMYIEVTKNLEYARFNYQQHIPFIRLVDRPIYPLNPRKTSWTKRFIQGLLTGGLMGVVLVFVRKFYLDVMRS